MPALSSEDGVQISHAPSLVAFHSSLVRQHALMWLDVESMRIYCIVVKRVDRWSREEVKFTGSFRPLHGADVEWWRDPESWDLYSELDEVTQFEGMYCPEQQTAKLHLDKNWLDELVAHTKSQDGQGVVVVLRGDDAPLGEDEASTIAQRNVEIVSQLARAAGEFSRDVDRLEEERLDNLLIHNRLTASLG